MFIFLSQLLYYSMEGEIWRYLDQVLGQPSNPRCGDCRDTREDTKEPSLIHRVDSLVCEWPQRCSHGQIAAWHLPLIQIVEVEAVFIVVTCHNTVMCFNKTTSVTFKLSWCGQLFLFCQIFSVLSACLWDMHCLQDKPLILFNFNMPFMNSGLGYYNKIEIA